MRTSDYSNSLGIVPLPVNSIFPGPAGSPVQR
jgi:hypothetical protein